MQDDHAGPATIERASDFQARTAGSVERRLRSAGSGTVAIEHEQVVVRTAPRPWEYAAALDLASACDGSAHGAVLTIEFWVNRGTVGIGLLQADGQAFLVEHHRTSEDGIQTVAFTLPEAAGTLIIRNGAAAIASAVTIGRIGVHRITADPLAPIREAVAPDPARARSSRPIDATFSERPRPGPAAAPLAASPLVSMIMTVKNGMPHLPQALASLERQSYRNFEVVVQDCLSTDGTLDVLSHSWNFDVLVDSRRDGGIGDANNRALARCRGAIVGSIDSDNMLRPNAIEAAVAALTQSPCLAVVYGGVAIVDEAGRQTSTFVPDEFDFTRFIGCDLVPPWSTAFFAREACGSALAFDPELKTCVDYDVWLRLSHLPIGRLDAILGETRLSDSSMTCRPDRYDQFCRDKIAALRRYLDGCAHEALRRGLLRQGICGIYCWAAESLLRIAPHDTGMIQDFLARASAALPHAGRVAALQARLAGR